MTQYELRPHGKHSGIRQAQRGRRLLRVALGVVASLFPATVASGQNTPARPQDSDGSIAAVPDIDFDVELDRPTAERVDGLIATLGHADFQTRERAMHRLMEIGVPAFGRMRRVHRQTTDLEIKLRIERIVYTVYLEHYVYARKGFLGVQMRPYGIEGDTTVTLPPGTPAVTLTDVIAGTAAFDAGLAAGDVVTAIDGSRFTGNGLDVQNQFIDTIAAHGPGDHLIFTIRRGDEELDIDVALGRCPPEIARQGTVRAINEAIPLAQQQFEQWWQRSFTKDTSGGQRGFPAEAADHRPETGG